MEILGGVGDDNGSFISCLGQMIQQQHKVFLRSGVQTGGGLVQEKELVIGQKLYRNAGPFFLSSR